MARAKDVLARRLADQEETRRQVEVARTEVATLESRIREGLDSLLSSLEKDPKCSPQLIEDITAMVRIDIVSFGVARVAPCLF